VYTSSRLLRMAPATGDSTETTPRAGAAELAAPSSRTTPVAGRRSPSHIDDGEGNEMPPCQDHCLAAAPARAPSRAHSCLSRCRRHACGSAPRSRHWPIKWRIARKLRDRRGADSPMDLFLGGVKGCAWRPPRRATTRVYEYVAIGAGEQEFYGRRRGTLRQLPPQTPTS
jgi:hypothetical protein